jgi:hypothetical protein
LFLHDNEVAPYFSSSGSGNQAQTNNTFIWEPFSNPSEGTHHFGAFSQKRAHYFGMNFILIF